MEFELHFSKFIFTEKPHNFNYKTQSWKHYKYENVGVEGMAKFIGQGRCWRNGQYDKAHSNFKKENAIGTRFIVLDFDECPSTPFDVVQKGIEIGKKPNMWYYSFSQGIKSGNNFRVIWILKDLINAAQFEATIEKFLKWFGEFGPDGNAKDISRMWYAGNRGVEVVSKDLHDWITWDIKVSPKTITEANRGHTERLGDVADVYSIDVIHWEDELNMYCPLWRKFASGQYLHRFERLALFTNLKYIKGSYERVLEIVDWDVYKEMNSKFGVLELHQWWSDTTLRPRKIIEKGKNKYTVPEWFDGRGF